MNKNQVIKGSIWVYHDIRKIYQIKRNIETYLCINLPILGNYFEYIGEGWDEEPTK